MNSLDLSWAIVSNIRMFDLSHGGSVIFFQDQNSKTPNKQKANRTFDICVTLPASLIASFFITKCDSSYWRGLAWKVVVPFYKTQTLCSSLWYSRSSTIINDHTNWSRLLSKKEALTFWLLTYENHLLALFQVAHDTLLRNQPIQKTTRCAMAI